jgi:hypothetical protein
MQALQEGLQQMQSQGADVSPIGKTMERFDPLMKQGKVKEAEGVLDEALTMLQNAMKSSR